MQRYETQSQHNKSHLVERAAPAHLHANEAKTTSTVRRGRRVGLPVVDSDDLTVTVVEDARVERAVVYSQNHNEILRARKTSSSVNTYTMAKRDHACQLEQKRQREQ